MANKRRVINYEKCRLDYTEENNKYWMTLRNGVIIRPKFTFCKILFIKYHYNINLYDYITCDFYKKFFISRKSLRKRHFIKFVVFPVIAHILCSYHEYNDYNGDRFNYAVYRRTMKEIYFTYIKHQKTVNNFAEEYAAEIKRRLHKKANAILVLLTQKYGLQNDLYNSICEYIS